MPRNGGDRRGCASARRRRKRRLLADVHLGGDGETVPCFHCQVHLTLTTLEQDRIVPATSYRYANIIPACSPCNKRRGQRPILSFPPQLSFPA